MAANAVPFELLRQIFSHLDCPDLVRVSCVNSSWHEAAVGPLYSAPRLFPRSLITFLRTMLTPSLASLRTHVHTLSLTWRIIHLEPIDPGVLSLLRVAAAHHDTRPPTHMSLDSLVPLLLHLLPRVHTLHLFPPGSPTRRSAFLGTRPRSVHLPLALRSVRTLSCTWFGRRCGVSTHALLALLALPALASLEVHIVDEVAPTLPQGTSAVSALHISFSTVSLASLARVLRVPRALRRLRLASTRAVARDAVYAALAPLRPTLELLQLRFGGASRAAGRPALQRGRTFRDWPGLTGVRCAMGILVAAARVWEVLPRGIRELAVETDSAWNATAVVAELEQLLSCRADGVPCLKMVTVGLGGWNRPASWRRLQALCEAAGVVLVAEVGFCSVDGEGIDGAV